MQSKRAPVHGVDATQKSLDGLCKPGLRDIVRTSTALAAQTHGPSQYEIVSAPAEREDCLN